MTWFLIGQFLIIGVVFAWRKNSQVKQQPQEMSETEEVYKLKPEVFGRIFQLTRL